MQALGADIPKIAVMPRNKKDVLTLLAATEEMVSVHADRPIITMSMGRRRCDQPPVRGSIRFGSDFWICGEGFGTGQMKAEDLRTVLELLHNNL